ncbi:MAG: aminoglycoside phosphotransferase family protein [Paludibacteraceae bacterium]|nr:aminoglycoside phosphotransferase family protein [Paludibacteraceae bacterium]
MEKAKQLFDLFEVQGTFDSAAPLGAGLINDTYKVTTKESNCPDYLLQRINHAIFQNVEMMQNNIFRVTSHLRKKLEQRGETDIDRKVLTPISTKEGKLYHFDGESYWRFMLFIPSTKTIDSVTEESAYAAGRAFGQFQCDLSDLPGEPLGETIPNFHNIEFRLQQLHETIEKDAVGRVAEVQELIDEITKREEELCLPERLFREGKLTKRINHCDTKVNNMLFDENGDFLCVIDLDTVMPGYVLSDIGDFIRTGANTGAEDDENLNNVEVNLKVVEAYTKGYLETATFLSPIEKSLLPFGGKLLTYMQTVRFLTDYINGDTYYKVKHAGHNLQRTKAQFKLLQSIEAHFDEMNEFVK